MATTGRRPPPGEFRLSIPPAYLKAFSGEPRLLLKDIPGLLILDARTLTRNPELLKELLADERFSRGFDIVAVPKGVARG
jgi:hypothetical protein